jgi:ribose transport system permease protein
VARRPRLRSAATSTNGTLAALVVLAVVALSAASSRFRSGDNTAVLLQELALTIPIGLSQMATLAVGELNLSVGALGGLLAVTVGWLLEIERLPVALAIPVVFGFGVLAGAINGGITAGARINGFIVTLGTTGLFTGISLGVTQSIPFYNLPAAFTAIGVAKLGPVSYGLAITLLMSLLLAFLFDRTLLGREMLAVGGNRAAAIVSGLFPGRAVICAHALSGLFVAVAAVIAVAQTGSAQPSLGSTWVLESFAVPIIGGTALSGGYVSVFGAAVAAAIVALIDDALILFKVSPYWVQLLLGIVILTAVGIARLRHATQRGSQRGGLGVRG